jgi:orotate phosphoribosyltransferase-like protein
VIVKMKEMMALAKKRRAQAWELKRQGWTYRQIGEWLGLSIERVRQLVHQHAFEKYPALAEAYRQRRWERQVKKTREQIDQLIV